MCFILSTLLDIVLLRPKQISGGVPKCVEVLILNARPHDVEGIFELHPQEFLRRSRTTDSILYAKYTILRLHMLRTVHHAAIHFLTCGPSLNLAR